MRRACDYQQLFVVRVGVVLYHRGVGVAAEVAGVCLFAVHDEHRAADFVAVLEYRLVEERLAARDVPAAVGVQRTRVIAALRLIVGVVVLDELRRVLG